MSARSLRTRRVGAASDNSTELSNARPLSSSSKRQRSPSDDSTQHLKKCKASRSSPKLELSCGVRFKPDQKLPDNHLQNLRFRPRCLLLNAILSDNEGALVLLITMKAGPHILKLYPPHLPHLSHHGLRFTHEYEAYTILENTHHRQSVAPRCYGCVRRINLESLVCAFESLTDAQMKHLRSTHFAQACPGGPEGTDGRALLIQHIPGKCALHHLSAITDDVIKQAEQGMKDLHRRGVVHGDPAPRNLLITEENAIVWIDYDSARTTTFYDIDAGRFDADFSMLRRTFRVDPSLFT